MLRLRIGFWDTGAALDVASRRCAQQVFSFVWRPWEVKPEIWAPDGTPIECTTDEHFVPTVRRTKTPLKAAPCCGVGC